MSTWYDLKLATLQKMFAADDTILTDESTAGYLAAMPHCANEGLALLSTAGKYVVKCVKIAQLEINNLLPSTISDTINEFSDTFSFTAEKGQSYYFECVGTGTCTINVDGSTVETLTLDASSYEVYKGLIPNTDGAEVEFVFTTSYPMALKNIAIYSENFSSADNVIPFTDKVKYNMTDLASDFYMIDPQGIYYEGAEQKYLQTSEFYQEGTKTLILDRNMTGLFSIYYRAYPEQITSSTADDYELPVDPEVYALLPLYMASQLYKDDDNGIATSYRNEFEVGFERLVNSANLSAYEEWTSESGWV